MSTRVFLKVYPSWKKCLFNSKDILGYSKWVNVGIFRRVNELLERRFTLQKGWTYSPLRVNHPSWRVNHPQKGWITLLKGEPPRSLGWKRVNEGWITLLKGEWKKGESNKGEWRVNENVTKIIISKSYYVFTFNFFKTQLYWIFFKKTQFIKFSSLVLWSQGLSLLLFYFYFRWCLAHKIF